MQIEANIGGRLIVDAVFVFLSALNTIKKRLVISTHTLRLVNTENSAIIGGRKNRKQRPEETICAAISSSVPPDRLLTVRLEVLRPVEDELRRRKTELKTDLHDGSP